MQNPFAKIIYDENKRGNEGIFGYLFHRNAFRQVSRLVHVPLELQRAVICENLQGHNHEKWIHMLVCFGHVEDMVRDVGDFPVPFDSHGDHLAAPGLHFLHAGVYQAGDLPGGR